MTTTSLIEQIDQAIVALKARVQLTTDEAELVDYAGEIRSLENRLADIRRTAASELADGTKGRRWLVSISNKRLRSYDSKRILFDLTGGDTTRIPGVLARLLGNGTVRLSWNHSKLEKEMAAADVTMVTAQREITDDDPSGAHVGVVWTTNYPAYTPLFRDDPDD